MEEERWWERVGEDTGNDEVELWEDIEPAVGGGDCASLPSLPSVEESLAAA